MWPDHFCCVIISLLLWVMYFFSCTRKILKITQISQTFELFRFSSLTDLSGIASWNNCFSVRRKKPASRSSDHHSLLPINDCVVLMCFQSVLCHRDFYTCFKHVLLQHLQSAEWQMWEHVGFFSSFAPLYLWNLVEPVFWHCCVFSGTCKSNLVTEMERNHMMSGIRWMDWNYFPPVNTSKLMVYKHYLFFRLGDAPISGVR